ncbi:DUF4105 domain-containing protein [Salipiger sp. P9]|uniref:Lnb N-terminal periplasmic domain-containing protein n=1 Tax=Salipiger pentaromativorans TaxID=2943193 RepID=UPI00215896CE|nr:DUF4105 domain-containing protein [Salipiger pentaromativorans]MCR8547831.1 DUF4105 domain-containing protein [Salipiger pentaromativorans]
MTRSFRLCAHLSFALIALAGAAWSATAIWLHLDGFARPAALTLLAAALLLAGRARMRCRRLGWAVLAGTALLVGGWYMTISPAEDRDWAIDVARGVKAEVSGDLVTLSDLRDFQWHDRDEATVRWIDRTVDLRHLETVDMLTSVWDNPDIAHLLVSFGFADGQHVVFSVEIRREADEVFNELGGFFRQFELVLIGATEEDIVKLRTNYRKEQVSLYPVTLDAAQRRALFMAYVGLAQQLEARPRFYNTLLANCTTVVYGLAQVLKADLPIDRRLILSGRLPEYIEALGVLGGNGTMADRRAAALITAKAQAAGDTADFSAAIRAH